MAIRDAAPTGAPCWIDLSSSEAERAREFYGRLFGWTAEDMGQEYGHYGNLSKDGLVVAGLMENGTSSGSPDGWSTYLAVVDAQVAVRAAVEHHGQVLLGLIEVGDQGTMALVADPGGSSIGLWQANEHAGFRLHGEAGTALWRELLTHNYADSIAFYQNVFQWETRVDGDTDDFRYSSLVAGGDQYAGLMDASRFLPESVPSHWSVYFGVDDVDAAVNLVTDMGGSILMAAEDTPYGRLATETGPTGAMFKLSSLADKCRPSNRSR